MLARVGLAANPRAAGERPDRVRHLPPRGMKQRHRRPGPDENPHVNGLGLAREQLSQDLRTLASEKLEGRREVPVGEVHELASVLDRLRDRAERVGAVDQDLERAALTRKWIA